MLRKTTPSSQTTLKHKKGPSHPQKGRRKAYIPQSPPPTTPIDYRLVSAPDHNTRHQCHKAIRQTFNQPHINQGDWNSIILYLCIALSSDSSKTRKKSYFTLRSIIKEQKVLSYDSLKFLQMTLEAISNNEIKALTHLASLTLRELKNRLHCKP